MGDGWTHAFRSLIVVSHTQLGVGSCKMSTLSAELCLLDLEPS